MSLSDLGRSITGALRNITSSDDIDQPMINTMLNNIAKALMASDVNIGLITSLNNNIKKNLQFEAGASAASKKRQIQKVVYNELVNLVDPGVEPFKPKKGQANVIMFVGLQGSGKTTTCTKLAYNFRRKGWRTGLVCADTFRAGAFDQLTQNATKAQIPYYGSHTETDPVVIAQEGVKKFKSQNFEIIIVDTSGRHKQEADLFEEMVQIERAISPDEVIFVMDASIGQAAKMQATAFKKAVDVGSVIITKLDGHAKGGGALSAYFQAVQSMGPISQVMGMIPGFSQSSEFLKGSEPEIAARFSRLLCVLESMTETELDDPEARHFFDESLGSLGRRRRVARGSGVPMFEVELILSQYKQMGGLMKTMGTMQGLKQGLMPGMGGPGGGQAGVKGAPSRQQLMKMQKEMMKQMGGPEAMKAAMRQAQQGGGIGGMLNSLMGGGAGGAGGMPDMGAMMQRMMGGAGGAAGMPNMNAMMQQMMGAGAGGPGAAPGMPDMNAMMQMMGGAGGAGGMPDMSAMMQQMMGGGAGAGPGAARPGAARKR
ncbi:hypothetical protein H696_01404 [Fonticula alba]|uniref:signal-recognition-particle GTPase n=1 Tax=Fonticula alba TaxID=691883 RepID=A0A058ZEV7_FONAL|nr:hypothetical protein H696_01404 [Fonticula alba]KCV71997.1 hypothetical protein H696_01404 [Fonticula alba]|eukprot:XP_009493575.1 hypothetical protein H696_01404 [Fonticula alba]